MKSASTVEPKASRISLAFLLGWLVPGAGHLLIGEKIRGTIFLIAIALTFWTGVAVGGVKNTVNRQERTYWFLGQICAGCHTLATMTWSNHLPTEPAQPSESLVAYGRAEEVSVVYTGICGMLNILILLDLSTRLAGQGMPSAARRGPPIKA